jgi:hypothetical protein
MGALPVEWAARLLSCLLRDGDGVALLGDLAEERTRRSRGGAREAARWYRRELYSSLSAVVWLRAAESVRRAPWGVACAAYLGVAVLEVLTLLVFSRAWPGGSYESSAGRLVLEFPGIAAIAYVAASFRRGAPFVLGGMMLVVATLISAFTSETLSMTFIVAFVGAGPMAAWLGGLLRRRRMAALSAGAVVLVMAGAAHAQEVTPVNDPSKTAYGEKDPRAPRELDIFAFLIGSWEGTGRTKLPDGKVAEYPVKWVGRYILDGMVIADEVHAPNPDGSPALGITFRQYDTTRAAWIIEFLNVSHSFLRRQVRPGTGSVAVNGRNVTIHGEALGMKVREHYLVRDDANWVYSMDMSSDGGKTWDNGTYEFTFRRAKP